MQSGFLGIDESNHGRCPEFYVGAFSTIKHHAERSPHKLSKIRTTAARGLEGSIYKHIRFDEEVVKEIGIPRLLPIAVGELAGYFNAVVPLKKVVVDGECRHTMMAVLDKVLFAVNRSIELVCEREGDLWYPVVNEADRVARRLYRDHASKRDTMDARSSLLLCDVKKYEPLLRLL